MISFHKPALHADVKSFNLMLVDLQETSTHYVKLGSFFTRRNFPRGMNFSFVFDAHSPPIGL